LLSFFEPIDNFQVIGWSAFVSIAHGRFFCLKSRRLSMANVFWHGHGSQAETSWFFLNGASVPSCRWLMAAWFQGMGDVMLDSFLDGSDRPLSGQIAGVPFCLLIRLE
jgi:hypothetical protein